MWSKQEESATFSTAPIVGLVLPETPPPPYYSITEPTEDRSFVCIIPPTQPSQEDPPNLNLIQSSTLESFDESPTPKNSKIPLHCATKGERNVFFRKVYGVVAIEGMLTSGIIATMLYCPKFSAEVNEVIDVTPWIFWTAWGITTAIFTCLTTSQSVMRILRMPPMTFVLVSIGTVIGAALLGILSAFLRTNKILVAGGIITGICILVILFTLQEKIYFTPTVSTSFIWTCLAITLGLLKIFYNWEESCWILLGPYIFFTYMVVSTFIMIKDEDLLLLSNEYIFGAVSVSMFFVSGIKKALCCPCCCSCTFKK